MSTELFIEKINQTPHAKWLNLQLVSTEDAAVTIKLPFSDNIIGDPINRTIHSGAITTLVDTASGAAIFHTQNNFRAMATLDLRIDHMRPAPSGVDINARADCYRLSNTIAFVRATVFTDDINKPIATALGSFIRSNKDFPVN